MRLAVHSGITLLGPVPSPAPEAPISAVHTPGLKFPLIPFSSSRLPLCSPPRLSLGAPESCTLHTPAVGRRHSTTLILRNIP